MFVAGRRPVLEVVRAGAAREVLVAEEARSTPGLREAIEAAGAREVPVRRVPVDVLEARAEDVDHQGVMARVLPPPELTESDLFARRWPEDALVVVLDGVTDPRNLGAIARTAEAAGSSALVVRRRRGAGLTAAAMKASAGALVHLPVAAVANVARTVARLRDSGFWVVGLDERGSATVLGSKRPSGRLAVVLGDEGRGLSRLVREGCDELIRIPMRGRVASLNVSVAAGVALFAYARPGKDTGEAGGG
jgi:23S rRNA (guanosine2251-2'-O)-methyltransferase